MRDPDTQAVIEALDDAQRASGLDQRSFARALDTSPSRYSTYRTGATAPSAAFLMRARRIALALKSANEQGTPTSILAATSIQAAVDKGDPDWAFALTLEARDRLNDTFAFRPDLLAAWEAGPQMSDPRWRAFLSAVVRNAFQAHGAPAPRWTERGVALSSDWFPVESIRLDRDQVKANTPHWLAERRVFVAERDMATA